MQHEASSADSSSVGHRSERAQAPRYVIVTPARNEEANIRYTLDSMLKQSVRPLRWVIVDDGSTDRTGAIVEEYARRHDFIVPVAATGAGRACFGSKVLAFHAGYARLAGLEYDYIGNLDGDVSFEPNYFEALLARMEQQQNLGLAGGIILEEVGGRFVRQRISTNSVAGAVQLFRRRCYEAFGGYRPLELGGIDSMAEIMARMHGWEARTFDDLEVHHHGRVTTGARNVLFTRFKKGRINHALGYAPLFQLCVGLARTTEPPYVVGGLLTIAGYAWAALRREKRSLPPEAVEFLRAEQAQRLRTLLTRKSGPRDRREHGEQLENVK